MRRIAFIGASIAWAGANATDEVVRGLADAVSDFGWARIAERDVPRALGLLEQADAASLEAVTARALLVADFAVDRELGALQSIDAISTGSAAAKTAVANKVQQWELYRAGWRQQLTGFARVRQSQLVATTTAAPKAGQGSRARPPAQGSGTAPVGQGFSLADKKYDALIPRFDPAVKGREFSLQSWPKYTAYMKEHPDALKTLGLTPQQATSLLNYVNSKRSIVKIRNAVIGETGRELTLDAVAGYLEMLKAVGWIDW
jgi:hypothetical protein